MFSGGVTSRNWLGMKGVVCPNGHVSSAPEAGDVKTNAKTNTSTASASDSVVTIRVERAPANAALLGAAKYALGGGKQATDIWSCEPS
jgi:hypothetical protein